MHECMHNLAVAYMRRVCVRELSGFGADPSNVVTSLILQGENPTVFSNQSNAPFPFLPNGESLSGI